MDVCNLDDKPQAFAVTKGGKFLDYQLCQSQAFGFCCTLRKLIAQEDFVTISVVLRSLLSWVVTQS
jgi:hypothetical protein